MKGVHPRVLDKNCVNRPVHLRVRKKGPFGPFVFEKLKYFNYSLGICLSLFYNHLSCLNH